MSYLMRNKTWKGLLGNDGEPCTILEESQEEDNVINDADSTENLSSSPNSSTSLVNNQEAVSQENSENSSSSRGQNRKTRSLRDLYESTQSLNLDDFADFALFSDADPLNYEEARLDSKWREAMDREMNSILKNNAWELVDLPSGHKSIGVRWIYKTKFNEKGEVDKYKARLVVKGYKQQYGINYQEVFAPVIRLETLRLVLAMAAQNDWKVHQMDVKSAFLNGYLEEDVYVDQPCGYKRKGQEDKVCHLRKALYGLKQAPRAWYSRIEGYFIKCGFKKCNYEHTLFIKKEHDKLSVYMWMI